MVMPLPFLGTVSFFMEASMEKITVSLVIRKGKDLRSFPYLTSRQGPGLRSGKQCLARAMNSQELQSIS